MITSHGSNKLESERPRALDTGVGHIVVDSFEEIARLAYLTDPPVPGRGPAGASGNGSSGNGSGGNGSDARAADKTATPRPRVLVRVTTGVEAHTHEFVATAHDDQKFGFSLSSGAADEAVRRVLACPGVGLAGLPSP